MTTADCSTIFQIVYFFSLRGIAREKIVIGAVWGRKLSSSVLKEEVAIIPIHPDRGEQAIQEGDSENSEAWFDQAADYRRQAVVLSPGNYIEAQNWLKITGRSSPLKKWKKLRV